MSPCRSSPNLRHVALPIVAGQRLSRLVQFFRRDAGMGGDRAQQGLVPGDIVEHAGEKAGLAGGRAYLAGTDPGEREEAFEMLGIAREIAERRNRQRRGRVLARLAVDLAGARAAFPDHLMSVPEVIGAAGGVST